MKKLLITLLIIHLSLVIAPSQSGWFWLNPQPYGNETGSIYFFNAQTGILRVYNNTLLKTTNAGSNWNVFSDCGGFSLYDFHFFDNINGIAFSSAGYYPPESIIRTTNGGSNWFYYSTYPLNTGRSFFQTKGTSTCFGGSINTMAKIVKSTNSGLDWSVCYQDSSFWIIDLNFASATVGFMTGGLDTVGGSLQGLFKTTNGGFNWFHTTLNSTGFSYRSFFLNDNTGFADLSYASGADTLFKTTNGAISWNRVSTCPYTTNNIFFLNENTGYINNIYSTTNGGLNWQYMLCEFDYSSPYKYSYAEGNAFALGTGIIAKSTNNGINWTELTSGYHTDFEDVRFINAQTGLISGNYGKLLKTTNGGANWNLTVIQPLFNNEMTSISMPDQNNWYVSEFMTGKILKSTNAGISWDSTYSNVYGPNRIKFINAQTGFGVCKYNYFIKTTNAGTNWSVTDLQVSQNWALDFWDANTGLTGGAHTMRTTNGGINWTNITAQVGIYTADIQFTSQNIIYAGGNTNPAGVLLKSTNAGLNWISCTFPESISMINDIYFLNDNYGFVSSSSGLFRTTNGGTNFVKLGGPYATVYYFADSLTGYGVGYEGTIIKTTTGGGEPIGVQQISNEVPKSFELHQNYPNPFNPSTKIKFSVPVGQRHAFDVQLKIYDLTGREVATLINEQLSHGTYETTWDASNYASGVYFYQLTTEGFSLTKKMVLLK